jgi:uncharacterized membrane protein
MILWTALKRYFVAGLLVIVPIWGTYLILKALFTSLDGVLGSVAQGFLGRYIPGLGLILLVVVIFVVGLLATNLLGRRLVAYGEDLMHRLPVVRTVYATIKAVVDTLSMQGKEQFNRVVLIEFPRKGQYSLAFVTGVTEGEVQEVTKERVINVYVPTTPNPTSGYFLLVPESEIIPLTMSVEDGMKMIISGGLYTPATAKKTAGQGSRP